MRKWLCIVLTCLLCTPAFAETVQDQALLFIQEAGIEADSVMRIENSIIVTLADGGTATVVERLEIIAEAPPRGALAEYRVSPRSDITAPAYASRKGQRTWRGKRVRKARAAR